MWLVIFGELLESHDEIKFSVVVKKMVFLVLITEESLKK